MKHIILSPHLDDAVFSLGGLIHNLSEKNLNAEVWNIFAGKNPHKKDLTSIATEIHNRWGYGDKTVENRIQEDKSALIQLKSDGKYFQFLDAIYRKDDFNNNCIEGEPDFIKKFNPSLHQNVINEIQSFIFKSIEYENQSISIYTPLALANHADHKILRIAIDSIFKNNNNRYNTLYYYAEFPYTFRINNYGDSFAPPSAKKIKIELNQNNIQKWIAAILEYKSQIKDYWKNENELADQLNLLLKNKNQLTIWKK